MVTSREFNAYGRPLAIVTSFQYLGRVISESDYDWPLVLNNFSRERAVWKRMDVILSREGAELQVSRFFSKPWRRW